MKAEKFLQMADIVTKIGLDQKLTENTQTIRWFKSGLNAITTLHPDGFKFLLNYQDCLMQFISEQTVFWKELNDFDTYYRQCLSQTYLQDYGCGPPSFDWTGMDPGVITPQYDFTLNQGSLIPSKQKRRRINFPRHATRILKKYT